MIFSVKMIKKNLLKKKEEGWQIRMGWDAQKTTSPDSFYFKEYLGCLSTFFAASCPFTYAHTILAGMKMKKGLVIR
jgi:hypothetical protein